ncbi:MAG: hypothetical protein QGI83_10115 [Candidatus Latescibacteria bacterium]|nr:hypothetical protein [Candidatus Latescibacterota bacterium]
MDRLLLSFVQRQRIEFVWQLAVSDINNEQPSLSDSLSNNESISMALAPSLKDHFAMDC